VAGVEGSVESIHLVPDVSGLTTAGVETQDLDGSLLLQMRWNLGASVEPTHQAHLRRRRRRARRHRALSTRARGGTARRFETGGPAFFVQDRLGRKGASFRCYKLRTMYQDADARLESRFCATVRQARAEWERYAKLKTEDPRITRVGGFLSPRERRRVAAALQRAPGRHEPGRTATVTSRPSGPQMGSLAQTILKAQPGMTGLWQVSGRNELRFEQRLQARRVLRPQLSLWMDIAVLIRTINSVLPRSGRLLDASGRAAGAPRVKTSAR
jgi:undecaprenyl-phosphate galactose phosphotransferase